MGSSTSSSWQARQRWLAANGQITPAGPPRQCPRRFGGDAPPATEWRPAAVRLFSRLGRIQLRMSATSTAAALTGSSSLLFSTLMADDKESLALGLRRRDPELLDSLIEQYQDRLLRYLLYINGYPERAVDSFLTTSLLLPECADLYHVENKFQA